MINNTAAMQQIIDRHMEAAFEEMRQTLGTTPTAVELFISENYRDNSIESDGVYQTCKPSTMSKRAGVAGSEHHTYRFAE